MATTATLKLNSPATIAMSFNDVFAPSESKAKAILDKALTPYAFVQKVDRPFMSSHFVITFIPRQSRTELSWKQAFVAAFEGAGYEPEIQGKIEGGFQTSSSGGLLGGAKGFLTEVTEAPGITRTMSTVKWASFAVIGLMATFYLLPWIQGARSSRRRRRY